MNRKTFVTLNKTRLFTADQVVDIVQIEREKVLDNVVDKITSRLNDKDRFWKGMHKSIDLVGELRQAGE